MAYPKFYLWVKVTDANGIVEEGAVRIAAIEKKTIRVTDYLSRETIKTDPGIIHFVFPNTVCDTIKEEVR